jgi:hypothetical protein
MLNVVHALRGRRTKASDSLEFDFDESAITIGPNLSPSLNLVVLASP